MKLGPLDFFSTCILHHQLNVQVSSGDQKTQTLFALQAPDSSQSEMPKRLQGREAVSGGVAVFGCWAEAKSSWVLGRQPPEYLMGKGVSQWEVFGKDRTQSNPIVFDLLRFL